MANMRMAKKSRRPICSRGTMAFMMDFSTICRPRGRDRTSQHHRGTVAFRVDMSILCRTRAASMRRWMGAKLGLW